MSTPERFQPPALERAATARITMAGLALMAIVLAGFTLRLIWVLHVPEPVLFGDAYWYAAVAKNVANGHGYAAFIDAQKGALPTAYYPPLYSVALAALWKIMGTSVAWAQAFNAVLSTITIVFVYAIGNHIFDRRAGLFAAAAFAVLPNDVIWTPLVISEPLFTLLFTAGLWALLVSRPWTAIRGPLTVLAFGLLAGLAILTRGEGLVLLAAAIVFWLQRDGRSAAMRQVAFAAFATMAIITPWTVRNWIQLDTFIPVSSNTGVNLRVGHASGANGSFTWLVHDSVDGVPGWRSLERPDWEVRGNRVYTRRAVHYAVTHPWGEVQLAQDKVYYLYRSDSDMFPGLTTWSAPLTPGGLEDVLRPLLDAVWFFLVFATVASMPWWLRGTPERVLPATVLLLWTAFHIVFFGMARFHLPLLPIMVAVSVGGVLQAGSAGLQRWRDGRRLPDGGGSA